jgi:hypothetical protein
MKQNWAWSASSDGITIEFQWPESISPESYSDLLYHLEGLKSRVGRAIPAPETTAREKSSSVLRQEDL